MLVKRGPESWTFIHIAFGFSLTIESAMISMAPLDWPKNAIFLGFTFILSYLFFYRSGWFQNKLIGFKSTVENYWDDPHGL